MQNLGEMLVILGVILIIISIFLTTAELYVSIWPTFFGGIFILFAGVHIYRTNIQKRK